MSTEPIASFALLDGTSIPWLGLGNGTGRPRKHALETGALALKAGIRHIDTAQIYLTEEETGIVVREGGVPKDEIYVTSKLSNIPMSTPLKLSEVRPSIQRSIDRLGFVPDLFLIHSPIIAAPGELKALWKIFEELKDEGKLKSIGVSNFQPQDIEAIVDGCKYIPVVNQLEYHPYLLTHLEPLLELQKKYGIVTQSYGGLSPLIRRPGGAGPLESILKRVAVRLTKSTGKNIDQATVLILWIRAKGVVAVTASGNAERIKWLAEVGKLPGDLLEEEEIKEIDRIGRGIHYRGYPEHMKDMPAPDLPS